MLRIRKILLALTLIVGLGSLGATVAYGWYLHSDTYCRKVQQRVSAYLDLPIQIGSVNPLTLDSLEAHNVRVRLPSKPGPFFACSRAVWSRTRRANESFYRLELTDGTLTIESPSWQKPDYRRALESGLAHDFADVGLKEVVLQEMDIRFVRPNWDLRLGGTSGVVQLDTEDGDARANLQSRRINGHEPDRAIECSARFRSGKSLAFYEVKLRVPRIAARFLNLDAVLQTTISRGTFSGQIIYREEPEPSFEIAGALEGFDLAELTAALPRGPIRGEVVELSVESARFQSGELQRVVFHGKLQNVQIADLATLFDQTGLEGHLNLQVDTGLLIRDRLAVLRAQGSVGNLDLARLTELVGLGTIAGQLDLQLKNLEIIDNRVVAAEIEARAQPREGQLPTIDREVVRLAAEYALGITFEELPFEQLEYVHLGARLTLEEGRLRVEGLYGPDLRTILTMRLFGKEVPLIRAPEGVFELGDLWARIQERATDYDFQSLLRSEQGQSEEPATGE